MNRFAALLDRLSGEAGRSAKLRLLTDYFAGTPDPDRGFALAAMTGTLHMPTARPALVRSLVAERTDPVLFALSYDFVGDLAETAALIWPGSAPSDDGIALGTVVTRLGATGRAGTAAMIAETLDTLDENGRWAFLKLITGGLRIGVSARLAKVALAMLGNRDPAEIEEIWHGLAPPYLPLFAWLEGRGPVPRSDDPTPFRTPMLAHPLDESRLCALDVAAHVAEWKWDGVRVQAVIGRTADGTRVARLYSRSGDDISASFPDVLAALPSDTGALDGELLVMREGRVAPFADLQQRLNRKKPGQKLLATHPAHLRAYDLLAEDGEDLRALPFTDRRARLEAFIARNGNERLDISHLVAVDSHGALAAARANPAVFGAGEDADAIEGLMLKRRDSSYVAGRPAGLWWKWKRAPFNVDAVLMYAQRGHGKRSSFYSDYTFGVWAGDSLVPVGKAYSGFTDEELLKIDRFVRANTVNRFGPVREVRHASDFGLVFEVAFEGLNRSGRHKSGVAMRFPRIARIRWDKPAHEAGTLQDLELLLG